MMHYNAELERLYNQQNIVGIMKSRRLEWAGHSIRMNEERRPRMVMKMVSEGMRPVGRPRKRWSDGMREDLTRLDTWRNCRESVEDIREWRTLVVSSCGPMGLIA